MHLPFFARWMVLILKIPRLAIARSSVLDSWISLGKIPPIKSKCHDGTITTATSPADCADCNRKSQSNHHKTQRLNVRKTCFLTIQTYKHTNIPIYLYNNNNNTKHQTLWRIYIVVGWGPIWFSAAFCFYHSVVVFIPSTSWRKRFRQIRVVVHTDHTNEPSSFLHHSQREKPVVASPRPTNGQQRDQ